MTLTLKCFLINLGKCSCNFLGFLVDLDYLAVLDLNCCVMLAMNQNLYAVDYQNDVELLQTREREKKTKKTNKRKCHETLDKLAGLDQPYEFS